MVFPDGLFDHVGSPDGLFEFGRLKLLSKRHYILSILLEKYYKQKYYYELFGILELVGFPDGIPLDIELVGTPEGTLDPEFVGRPDGTFEP